MATGGRALQKDNTKKAETPISQTDLTRLPLEEEIQRRAYEIYLQRGGQDGSELDDWLQAEQEILGSEPEHTAE